MPFVEESIQCFENYLSIIMNETAKDAKVRAFWEALTFASAAFVQCSPSNSPLKQRPKRMHGAARPLRCCSPSVRPLPHAVTDQCGFHAGWCSGGRRASAGHRDECRHSEGQRLPLALCLTTSSSSAHLPPVFGPVLIFTVVCLAIFFAPRVLICSPRGEFANSRS